MASFDLDEPLFHLVIVFKSQVVLQCQSVTQFLQIFCEDRYTDLSLDEPFVTVLELASDGLDIIDLSDPASVLQVQVWRGG